MKKIIAFAVSLLLAGMPVAFADDVSVTNTVDSFLTATFQYSSVAFGTLTQGTTDNTPTPSHTTGAYNVTIDTNREWTVSVSAVDFKGWNGVLSQWETMGIGNLTMDTDTTLGNLAVGSGTSLTTGSQDLATQQPYTATADYHGFWLDIPSGQYATSYNTNVTISYTSDG